ncbi:DUF2975 domain-containing protein [Mangrovivirga sp. M17]|uniref:DUF2975 domain-containing protein n=1 Tax=Mangrovivirga halotolerans TaxID=2993936 RepID=A0ABT3RVE3_9BACT|nr:DUF2975 domain-containing protein [Mangrovivirga halotolerans]MCX2745557.1 DUF2975 domain-containing protein [Mangrovivirga halotolerans]
MENNILKIALFTARLIRIIFIIGLVVVTGMMIIYTIDSSIFEFENFRMVEESFTNRSPGAFEEKGVPISNIPSLYIYLWSVKYLIYYIVLFFIVTIAIKIIKSIKSLSTFRSENVQSFRKIGLLFILMMALASISIYASNGEVSLKLDLELNYLIWALISFVMAEVFSEGNKLMEENKLTI